MRIGKEKLSDKGTRSADKRVDPMRSQTGLAREQIIDGFLEFFRSRYDTRDSSYTDAELDAARELVETKFGTQERSEEHTSELQSRGHLVCRLLLEKKNTKA